MEILLTQFGSLSSGQAPAKTPQNAAKREPGGPKPHLAYCVRANQRAGGKGGGPNKVSGVRGTFWVYPGSPAGGQNDLRLWYNAGTRAHKRMWKTKQTIHDKTRGGNHLKWGLSRAKGALRIAIRSAQPEIRPTLGFGLRDVSGPPRKWPFSPPERQYLAPQGPTGPQTGLIASTLTMQYNWVLGCFPQNGPQDRENPKFTFLARFGPWTATKSHRVLPPPKNQ